METSSIFIIIDSADCPVYRIGDEFRLTERALRLPNHKPACLTLMSDMAEALNTYEKMKQYKLDTGSGHLFNCTGYKTGCTGSVRLAHQNEANSNLIKPTDREIQGIVNVLTTFSIFKNLVPFELKEIVTYFRVKNYRSGEMIIHQGDTGLKLFIILSGKVEVLGQRQVSITYLGPGEVFGEMSLLTGEQVGASIRAIEPLKLLYIYGKYFRIVLQRFPSIQMYLTRLLAQRLSISNIRLEREFTPGIIGDLTEISPAELLQTLNMNNKTGSVVFTVPDNTARICLKEGTVISAELGDFSGIEAFFMILQQKQGRFKFNPGLSEEESASPVLGDFMYLLMEGVKRIDEGNV